MEQNIMVDYILSSPEIAQPHLTEVYNLLEELLGDKTTKVTAFQMPTYRAKKNVVYFNATKKHVGIYPGPVAIAAFQDEFGEYDFSKGTLRIKYTQPVPTELIKKLVLYSYELNS